MLNRRTFVAATAMGIATRAKGAGVSADARFPADFLWGAATAAHQVEGNNVNSDDWVMEHVRPSTFVEPSGDAANSFALWRTDLDIVKHMGLNSYRFSLEWARIEPEPGMFSIAMLDHYKMMIEGCRTRGLTPVVTFNHFTTPRWFAASAGWTNPQSPSLFARFCERAARHLAWSIGYATTLNEPNFFGMLPLVLPPDVVDKLLPADRAMSEAAARANNVAKFIAGDAFLVDDVAGVQANLRAAHRAGREAIKSVRPDLPVGVSLAIVDDQAVGVDSLRDAMRAKLYGAWLDAARGDDFVGVQNYERAVWNDKGKVTMPADVHDDFGSEIYPPSLAGAVRYAHAVSGIPIIVTEHGVNATDDRLRVQLIPRRFAS